MDRDGFTGKTVVVMGLGRFGGGLDAAIFAAETAEKVIVTDLAAAEKLSASVEHLECACGRGNVELHLGCHERGDFERADIVIANPAVPFANEYLQLARNSGALITSQVEIFFDICRARIVGITGANGKSTTTALTAHLLRGGLGGEDADYGNVWLGGNIGNEPLLTIVDQIEPSDAVVLELSSFQVEQLARTSKAPQIALLTNLTPNHLDRYGTFEKYCASKEHMFALQDTSSDSPAISLFSADDDVAVQWFEKYRSQPGRSCSQYSCDDVSEEIREVFRLPGAVNLTNLAGALAIVRQFGVSDEAVIGCLGDFRGLSHRLEFVEEVDSVRWYNDSKSTTPLSAIVGLEAFAGPTILIAGGYDKDIPFDELGPVIAARAKAAILIGETAGKIAESIGSGGCDIQRAQSLGEAVQFARRLAEPGDVVLMSPACASYDMFENFEQRGEQFCRIVRGFAGQTTDL